MENLVFTQLSVPEIRQLFREELDNYFGAQSLRQPEAAEDIGGIEVAMEVTGLARATVHTLTSQGGIPHYKRRGKLYFSRKELQEWIKAGRRKTTADLQAEAEDYTAQSRVRIAPRSGKARRANDGPSQR